jgi:hypothetical protein
VRLTPLLTMTLALFAVAGCASSGAGASAPPPAVVTPSTHATSSAPAPVPAPSTPATAEGAIAFVKAYYAEMNHALATNESETLANYSKENCPCRKVLATIEVNQSKGQKWSANTRIIDDISANLVNPVHVEVSVRSHWPATRLVASGKTVGYDPGHTASERILLDRDRSSWLISVVYGSYKALQ